MVERNTGEDIDIDRIPLDDEAPYTLLQKGDGLEFSRWKVPE